MLGFPTMFVFNTRVREFFVSNFDKIIKGIIFLKLGPFLVLYQHRFQGFFATRPLFDGKESRDTRFEGKNMPTRECVILRDSCSSAIEVS